jgi:hypothetical protein
MADALPGAAAPVPPAVLATIHTPQQPGPVPDPLALLRLLDGWMSESGFGGDHPWRQSIADSLRVARNAKAVELPEPVDGLLCGIACRMSALLDMIDLVGGPLPSEPVRALVAHAGYLADMGLQLGSSGPVKGGAAHWLLGDQDRAGLAVLGVQS